jgi:CRP-like cAMP-binding protein
MLAGCQTVHLAYGNVLYKTGKQLRHVYFPTRSFVSLVMRVDQIDSVEVGLVGSEGMLGVPLALGVDTSPVTAVVHGSGSALRMDAAYFCSQLESSGALQAGIARYVFVCLSDLAQTAACMRFHVVEARLARRLLMTQDRAHSDTFSVTQEFLASMLGVRRVGITQAATSLQKRKLIHYHRGKLTVTDRRGLRGASCACYRADRAAYDRTLA